MNEDAEDFEYVGFWPRVGATVVDIVLSGLLLTPLVSWFVPSRSLLYGDIDWSDLSSVTLVPSQGSGGMLASWLIPAAVVVIFWIARQATPGKMLIGARVVDARSGGKMSTAQAIGRYLGYYVSMFPFGLGLLWVAFDPRKQGWHDKLAGTVVIRPKRRGVEPVRFDGQA